MPTGRARTGCSQVGAVSVAGSRIAARLRRCTARRARRAEMRARFKKVADVLGIEQTPTMQELVCATTRIGRRCRQLTDHGPAGPRSQHAPDEMPRGSLG